MSDVLHDYSHSKETAWMRETTPGEFHRIINKFLADSHAGLLQFARPQDREIIGESPHQLTEEDCYRTLDAMDSEKRMRFLRENSLGYGTYMREMGAKYDDPLEALNGVPENQVVQERVNLISRIIRGS